MSDDLQLGQLLCTRLCHDLAGPIGAVSAGVELIGSDPTLIGGETLALLSGSAESVARKLKFLRIAFGWVGIGSVALDQVGGSFADYIIAMTGPSGGPTLQWPDQDALDDVNSNLGDVAAQSMANIVLVSMEIQPKCRTLSVSVGRQKSGIFIQVANKASDGAVRVREDIAETIGGAGDAEMTPQTVQAHLARRLVAGSGGRFDVEIVSDGVITTARWQ